MRTTEPEPEPESQPEPEPLLKASPAFTELQMGKKQQLIFKIKLKNKIKSLISDKFCFILKQTSDPMSSDPQDRLRPIQVFFEGAGPTRTRVQLFGLGSADCVGGGQGTCVGGASDTIWAGLQ